MKNRNLGIQLATLCLVCAAFFSGCDSTTQTTSGKDYLSKYPTTPMGSSGSVDAEVAQIASVEPLLRFPARIGLVKLYNGRITNLSPEEFDSWQLAREELGVDFGQFVPVSPIIAEMVYTPSSATVPPNSTSEVIRKIRMGAARQHLDAVLIYEVFSETKETTLASSIANWTIIGAYVVPSEELKTVAHANALLLDVRNGYPYGTASASATEEQVTTLVGHWDHKRNQAEAAQVSATVQLSPEVVDMFQELQRELVN